MSAPKVSTRPATPRNEAAERYSPATAEAFIPGPTVREATRKSLVVRDIRSPQVPITSVVRATSTTATAPGRVSNLTPDAAR